MSLTDVRYVVDAPTRTPHRYGLFSVLDFASADRGVVQLAWDSIGCTTLGIDGDTCINVIPPADKTLFDVGCTNEGGEFSFTVVAWDGSSLGRDRAPTSDRASQKLLLGEQAMVEAMVAEALLSVPGSIDSTPTWLGTGASWTEKVRGSFGAVEEGLQGPAFGGEGMLFVPRSMMPFLADYIVQTGSMLRTKSGTPVAAFAGWDSTQTAPTQIAGVSAMVALRGGVVTGNGWNLSINDHADFAERDYALGWECAPVLADPGTIV